MHKYEKELIINYSLGKVYDLVIDIEKYPEFLPWCKAARINEESEEFLIAELIINFKAFTEHYISKVTVIPPDGKTAEVNVASIAGPFKYLNNSWRLEFHEKSVTKVTFKIDFEFKTALLDRMVGLVFSKATSKMIEAFEKRAHDLYGEGHESEETKERGKRIKGT